MVRPPSRKAGTSKVAPNGPSPLAMASTSKGKWPRKVESPRLTSSQLRHTPCSTAAASNGARAAAICPTRCRAAAGARALVLASTNSSGEGWRRAAANWGAPQSSSKGQPCTVWEPVGSSSITTIFRGIVSELESIGPSLPCQGPAVARSCRGKVFPWQGPPMAASRP